MGEGWGDAFATFLRMRPEYTRKTDFLMGSYSFGGKGIRKFPYSSDMNTNPETYSYIKKPGYWGVHAKGEVWAMMLIEAYWNFVEKRGFDADWYNGTAGNNQLLHDIVLGMKLQPCRPTFVDARNAILQADKVNYNSKNYCLLWKAFAKRGLGLKATSGGNEDFTLPEACRK